MNFESNQIELKVIACVYLVLLTQATLSVPVAEVREYFIFWPLAVFGLGVPGLYGLNRFSGRRMAQADYGRGRILVELALIFLAGGYLFLVTASTESYEMYGSRGVLIGLYGAAAMLCVAKLEQISSDMSTKN